MLRLVFHKAVAIHALQVQFLRAAPDVIQPQPADQTRIVFVIPATPQSAIVWTPDSAPETRRNCVTEFMQWHLAALIIEPSAAPPPAVASRVVLECQKHQLAALNVELVVLIHLIILESPAVPFQNRIAISGPGSTICSVVLELTTRTLVQEIFLAAAVITKETIPFAATLPPPLIPPLLWVHSTATLRVS